MSSPKHLTVSREADVLRVTFARPKHNVLDIDMMDELNSLLEACLADADLKCLVLFGDGPSWCAGVEVADHKPEMAVQMIATFNRIFELMNRLEVPTMASVHGACLGGGMEVAIACDIIVAAQSAVFGQPEIKLGFLPPYAAVRLPQLVGAAKAIEICTTGKRYRAEEAQRMGFVTHVVADDQLSEFTEKLIAEIQYNSPLIIRLNKRAVKDHLGLEFQQAIDGVSKLFLNKLMKTEDTLEGIRSFEEKRRPEWTNK